MPYVRARFSSFFSIILWFCKQQAHGSVRPLGPREWKPQANQILALGKPPCAVPFSSGYETPLARLAIAFGFCILWFPMLSLVCHGGICPGEFGLAKFVVNLYVFLFRIFWHLHRCARHRAWWCRRWVAMGSYLSRSGVICCDSSFSYIPAEGSTHAVIHTYRACMLTRLWSRMFELCCSCAAVFAWCICAAQKLFFSEALYTYSFLTDLALVCDHTLQPSWHWKIHVERHCNWCDHRRCDGNIQSLQRRQSLLLQHHKLHRFPGKILRKLTAHLYSWWGLARVRL